jgi:hypothetical protein
MPLGKLSKPYGGIWAMREQTRALRYMVRDYPGWHFDMAHGGYACRIIPGDTETSWPMMIWVRFDSDPDTMAYTVDYKPANGLDEHVGLFHEPKAAMDAGQAKYREITGG